MNRRPSRIALLVAAVVLAAAMPAFAQDYPNRPIRFIVPYPPGGGTDVVARIMNDALAADLGQPIIIDNRGGAAGNVGTDIAAKAPADGYNILFTLVVAHDQSEALRQAAVRCRARFRADQPRGVDSADSRGRIRRFPPTT